MKHMSDTPMIQSVQIQGKDKALSAMMLAFSGDPFFRWFAPDPDLYVRHGCDLMNAFGGNAFNNGTAYASANYEGVSFWLPPGVKTDEELAHESISQIVPAELLETVWSIFGEMGNYHPKEDCWYLPLIGVDPARQGQGLGSALLKHALEIIDRNSLPAFLESSNPRNISLYERYGFEVVGRIQIGSSPPVHPMIRAAQKQN